MVDAKRFDGRVGVKAPERIVRSYVIRTIFGIGYGTQKLVVVLHRSGGEVGIIKQLVSNRVEWSWTKSNRGG